jgi:vancomycin resistance protein VanJ
MIRGSIRLFFYLQPALAVAWLIGVTLRDRWRILIPFFYVPAVLVAAAGLVWLVIFWRRRSALRGLVAAVAAAGLVKALAVDFAWHDERGAAPRSIRVVHWNIARGLFGPDALLPVLAADQADIYVLSEFPGHPDFYRLPAQLIPGGQVLTRSGMLLISRYPFEFKHSIRVPGAPGWYCRIATPYGPLDLLAIDLVSDPHRLRKSRMAPIIEWVAGHDRRVPLVIVGDFNTPRDSIYFEPLREHVFHAYEKVGRGWPYTWPTPFPLYAIDHAWVSPRVRIYRYRLVSSRLSDHRRQILDIRPQMPKPLWPHYSAAYDRPPAP